MEAILIRARRARHGMRRIRAAKNSDAAIVILRASWVLDVEIWKRRRRPSIKYENIRRGEPGIVFMTVEGE